jgi:DeoR family galactitol utilization operon repressor
MVQDLTEKERAVLDLLMDNSSSSVGQLSKALEVSQVTVRNTLNTLAEKGVIHRTWGGAAPAFHPAVAQRQRTRVEEKSRIARHAASYVTDGNAIMIEAGTTTAMIGRYLFGKRDLTIVTNSSLVIPYARANPQLQLTVVGGAFRAATESFVGPMALEQLARFHVSTAFVGTDGFSPDFGLTTHLVEGAEIVKQMAERAERTVLVADSSKFSRRGFVQVLPLDRVDVVLSDTELSQDARERISELGVEVETV